MLAYFLGSYYADVKTNFKGSDDNKQVMSHRAQVQNYDLEFVIQGEISLYYFK